MVCITPHPPLPPSAPPVVGQLRTIFFVSMQVMCRHADLAPAVAPPPGRRSLNESILAFGPVNFCRHMPSASCVSPHIFGACSHKAQFEQLFAKAAHRGWIPPGSSPRAAPGGPTQTDERRGACGRCAAAGGMHGPAKPVSDVDFRPFSKVPQWLARLSDPGGW